MTHPWNTDPTEKKWRDKTENSICCAFVDMAYKLKVYGNIDFVIYHIENERKCSFSQGQKRKRMGVLAGVFDYHVMWKTGHGYIEMKAGYNQLTESQEEFATSLDRYGVPYGVARTPNEAFKILEGWVNP